VDLDSDSDSDLVDSTTSLEKGREIGKRRKDKKERMDREGEGWKNNIKVRERRGKNGTILCLTSHKILDSPLLRSTSVYKIETNSFVVGSCSATVDLSKSKQCVEMHQNAVELG